LAILWTIETLCDFSAIPRVFSVLLDNVHCRLFGFSH
jgi:hypothetical protein